MVQIRKPVVRSEDILDYRVKRSPRGVIPSSAAAVSAAQKLDRQRRIDAMIAEGLERSAKMRWVIAARKARGGR